jgi:DNA-binding XRE family transcriptional regulator
MYAVDPGKLRGLRRRWLMSQPEFAEFVGINLSTLTAMEGSGHPLKYGVRASTLRRIIDRTGCSTDDLLRV